MTDYRFRTIRVDLRDRVATVTLARPDRLNALTPDLFAEVEAAIRAALNDGARAVVITGEGRAFSSGADLRARGEQGLPEDLGLILEQAYNPFVRFLADLDVPVVTAINGLAAGAGASLALAGDVSVMARGAYLLLSFVNIGLVPDAGASWLVARSIGRTRALAMALLGERMAAEEAAGAGLITCVVDDDRMLDEALAIARRLADGPTIAIGLIRKQIAQALSADLDQVLATERHNQATAGRTQDFARAVAAFAGKCTPLFEGN